MTKVRMHAFTAGTYVVDKGTLNNRDWGTKYEHPNPMYAFEHPTHGLVLFDTGVNHRGLADPAAWWGKTVAGLEIRVSEQDCMPARLRSVGLKPEDVKFVIMSHLHIDHAGEMESFPKATFVVRASEMKFAWWADPHMRHVYVVNDLKNTRGFEYLEIPDDVDWDLFGDGSMVLIHTPGHTPGHQSLIVDAEKSDRKRLLCADACYLRENLAYQIYSANLLWNAEAWCRTITRLRVHESLGQDLWMGHDMDDWKRHTR
jgi:glyoxylase-like metal-dependent hydrolase (beta-lactamase superfamily II)